MKPPGTKPNPSVATETNTASRIDIQYLVRALLKYNASDLHIKVGRPPLYRINGKLVPAKMTNLTASIVEAMIFEVLSPKQKLELEAKKQIDFSFRSQDMGRFRCNVYYQMGSLCAAIRMIPLSIPHLEDLGVPTVIKELCQRPRGLLLVTGATGSGKSTTLAAIVQYINENNPVHVLSIEDPIEFVHNDRKASITQREIGSDALSTREALIAGLRQDPDVIVIGEMREIETIQAAVTAAETGHLVISTLHTNDAKSTIERILDVFEPEVRNQIRVQLASTLIGVISQQLVLRADGGARVLACEVMVKSPAIEGYIMKNEFERISEAIANSNTYYKMQSMNQALERLVIEGTISLDEALKASSNPDDLKLALSGVNRDEGYKSTA